MTAATEPAPPETTTPATPPPPSDTGPASADRGDADDEQPTGLAGLVVAAHRAGVPF
jgi:hypothetical protein